MKKLFILILILAASPSFATTYYVATTGSNSNNGTTSGTPFLTIDYAVSQTAAGDTIYVADGTYAEAHNSDTGVYISTSHNGSSGNPITIRATNKHKAIINGGNTVHTGVYIEGNYITLDGLEIKNYDYGGISSYGTNTIIRNCLIDYNGSSNTNLDQGQDGIFISQWSDYPIIDSCTIHHNGRLTVTTGDYSGLDHGVYCCGLGSTITNNLIYSNQAFGIQLAGYGTMTGVTVYNNTIISEQNRGGMILWQPNLMGTVIKNNIFLANNGNGVDCYDPGSGYVINNNSFYGNTGDAIGSVCAGTYTQANNITTDPKLRSDYKLNQGSPCQDTGVDVGLTVDHDGNKSPQRSTPSMGAFEFIRPIIGGIIMPGK